LGTTSVRSIAAFSVTVMIIWPPWVSLL
jgi:hypothetical protein